MEITELTTMPEFNGKLVCVISYVENKERWKVHVLTNNKQKRYLGLKTQNLRGIPERKDGLKMYWDGTQKYKEMKDKISLITDINPSNNDKEITEEKDKESENKKENTDKVEINAKTMKFEELLLLEFQKYRHSNLFLNIVKFLIIFAHTHTHTNFLCILFFFE